MAWTDFSPGTAKVFPGFQVSINIDNDEWIHYLVAPLDEKNPRANHIHLKISMRSPKYELVQDAYLVAAVKVDNVRVINRRKLIENINRVTGLSLKYR